MKLLGLVTSAVAAAILGAATALVCAYSLLSVAGAPYFAVASNSMTPVMQRGDLVVTTPTGDLQVGDAVTFRMHGQLVTHRLVARGRQPHTFETRGDANPGNDPWTISTSDVVGKVQSVITRAGWPLLWLGTLPGRFALIAAVALAILALQWAWPRAAYAQALP